MRRILGEVITPYNVLRHELVGLNVRVIDASHEGYKCVGRIVGETKKTIKVKVGSRIKTLPKDSIVLELNLPEGCRVKVDGRLLLSRPEDRIKKKYRIKFT